MWAVRRDSTNYKEVNKFFNSLYKTSRFTSAGAMTDLDGEIQTHSYIHYPKYQYTSSVCLNVIDGYKLVTLKELEQMVNKEIIGYICPMDLYEGDIKKGDLFVRYNKNIYVSKDKFACAVPKEIVETWEPKYKQSFKVGDWVTVTTSMIPINNWLNDTEQRTFQITGSLEQFCGGLMYSTSGPLDLDLQYSWGIPESDLRLATIGEISAIFDYKFHTFEGKLVSINKHEIKCEVFSFHKKEINGLYDYLCDVPRLRTFAVEFPTIKIGCTTLKMEECIKIVTIYKNLQKLHEEKPSTK